MRKLSEWAEVFADHFEETFGSHGAYLLAEDLARVLKNRLDDPVLVQTAASPSSRELAWRLTFMEEEA